MSNTSGDGPILAELKKSLSAASNNDLDAAGVELARKYAKALDYYNGEPDDSYEVLTDIGPKFHKLLNDLGLLPAGRAAMKKGADNGSTSTGNSTLDAFRERARARAHGATPIHAATA